jgi:putative ABC transport system permease protein
MNLIENIKEALKAIRANLLRTILTALIIAIGITALVGILTAIDGLQNEVNSSMASLGANSFDIKAQGENFRGNRHGKQNKIYAPIEFKQALKFKDEYKEGAISIYTTVSGGVEVKYLSKKTNPNMRIIGINENYMNFKSLEIRDGRSFSNIDLNYGSNVAIIGDEIVQTLFKTINPINKEITFRGNKFRIIGVLEKQGSSFGGNGPDRTIFVPLLAGNRMSTDKDPRYSISVTLANPIDMDFAMGEAIGLMRVIRQDKIGSENSFEITRSESVADSMNEVTGYLKLAGFVIGFITLLGSSIGLMNIMMVSVTERTQEIGVRKALGATQKRIRQQFLIEAIVICVLGGIFGVILGILIGNVLASFLNVQNFVFPWLWSIVGLAICIIVGLFSGYYPAFKASKLDPIESLRFE